MISPGFQSAPAPAVSELAQENQTWHSLLAPEASWFKHVWSASADDMSKKRSLADSQVAVATSVAAVVVAMVVVSNSGVNRVSLALLGVGDSVAFNVPLNSKLR